jgi:hypothetical protein
MDVDFRGWVRQPSTILGIGTILGLIASALAAYEGGSVSAIIAFGGVVFGVVHLVLPDNSQAAADAQALAMEVVKDTANHALTTALPQILRDALRFLTDLKPAKPAPDPAVAQLGTGTGAIASTLGALLLMVALGLSACSMTPAQKAQMQTDIQTVEQAACLVDGVVQPIAAPVLATLVPQASIAVSIDNALVHPNVVKFCANLGGTPVAETATAAPVVPATPAALPVPPMPSAVSVTPIPTPATAATLAAPN